MSRSKYKPDAPQSSYRTFVVETGPEPREVNRRDEVSLPPGSATPGASPPANSALPPRTISQVSFSGPSSGSNVPSRTIPIPGERATGYKNDYGTVTRRTMTAYSPRRPWKRQRQQSSADRLDSARYYQRNKSRINQKAKRRYRVVKTDRRFQVKREDRRNDPEKFERQRAFAAGELVEASTTVEAYTPWSPSKRRHKQTGQQRQQNRQRYRRNRSKIKRQQKVRYRKLRRNPTYKRQRQRRRSQPSRYKLRVGSSDVTAYFGMNMQEEVVSFEMTEDDTFLITVQDGVLEVSAWVFANALVFDDDSILDLIPDDSGAWGDPDVDDLVTVCRMYGVEVPNLQEDEVAVFIQDVVDQSCCVDSPSGIRVASSWLQASGVGYVYSKEPPIDGGGSGAPGFGYRQVSPGEWTRDTSKATHAPTPSRFDTGQDEAFGLVTRGIVTGPLRTAATSSSILDRLSPKVAERATSVSVKLKRADDNMWTFTAKGSGQDYVVRVKAFPRPRSQTLATSDVRVSCSCDFFRFQGPEHWAKAGGYLYGKPAGTAAAPDVKDAEGKNVLCKHAAAALFAASKFKVTPSR